MHSEAYDIRLSDLGQWVEDTMKSVETDINDLQGWYGMQGHFYERRYGLHGRDTNDPWPGASDINIPTIDKMVTQMKPMIVRLLMGRPQPVGARPGGPNISPEKADALALYLNSVLNGKVPIYSQEDFAMHVDWMADDCCQTGAGLLMVDHCYQRDPFLKEITKSDLPAVFRQNLVFTPEDDPSEELVAFTQQAGKQLITPSAFDANAERFEQALISHMGLDVKDAIDRRALIEMMGWIRKGMPGNSVAIHRLHVVKDTPRITHVPREDLIVPVYTKQLRDARRVTYRYRMTEEELLRLAASERWDSKGLEQVLDGGPDNGSMLDETGNIDVRRKRSVTQTETTAELYTLYRIYSYKDLSGGAVQRVGGMKIPERVVLDIHASSKTPLKFRRLPYDHQQWPFRDIRFEPNEPGFYSSRGIPQILDDLDAHRTAWHRHKENNMLIQTTTSGFLAGSSYDSSDFEVYPGYIGRLDDPSDFVPLVWPQTALNISQEEQALDIMISSYLGTFAHDITADANLLEPRTATEVSLRNQNTTQVLDMRGRAIISQWNEVLKMFLSVAQQYAPDKFLAQITGSNPEELKASDIEGHFDVYPTATLEDMDPSFRMQKAMQRLQLAQQAAAQGGDPRYDVDVTLALKAVMDELGMYESRRFMRPRAQEEVEAIVANQQQQVADMQLQASNMRKMIANQPLAPEQVLEVLEKVVHMLPHKDFQNFIQAADAAVQGQIDAQGRLAADGR